MAVVLSEKINTCFSFSLLLNARIANKTAVSSLKFDDFLAIDLSKLPLARQSPSAAPQPDSLASTSNEAVIGLGLMNFKLNLSMLSSHQDSSL